MYLQCNNDIITSLFSFIPIPILIYINRFGKKIYINCNVYKNVI